MEDKIQTQAGVIRHGFDYEYQTYIVELDLMNCTTDNILQWDHFLDNLGNYNVLKLTLEREEQ